MDDVTLTHHGIKGMKWGVRRFQNKDGSRTSEGKKRAKASSLTDDELVSNVRRMTLEKQYKNLSKEPASKTEKTKKVVDAASILLGQAKKLSQDTSVTKKEKLDLSKMTDQELRDRINRTNLERQYNEMFAPSVKTSKGRQYVSNILDVAGSTLAVGSSALAIALAIKELRG